MTQSDVPVAAPTSLPPLGQVLDFMRLIWAVDHGLQRTSKRMERTLGVTGPQRFVIRMVGRFPGITVGDLARLLHVHPSTLTGIVGRLEESGAIRRRADPRDGRRSLLGLTDKGRRFDVATEGTIEAAMARALENMSSETLQAARDVLRSIANALAALAPAEAHDASARARSKPRGLRG